MPIITDIVLDEWISLGETRCASISAIAMREPQPEIEDMPLHDAVYDPTRGKIFAVRGGRVFKFNETTLAKENEVQYAGPTLSDSYIAYDAGRDKLWVTYSPDFVAPAGNQFPTNDKFIYKLNADNLGIEQSIGIGANNLESSTPSFLCNHVIRHIRSNGGQLAFWINGFSTTNGTQFVVFNPDSLPGSIFEINGLDGTGSRWSCIEIRPSSTDYLFCSDQSFNDGIVRRTNANVFVEQSETYPNNGINNAPPPITARIYGFAYVAANNKHYCANRSNLILKLDATNGFGTGTAIDLGPVIDVWNIRLNPNNGLLYAPDFIGNTVAVIDPSDDSFVLKAGFEAPWDVVFTSSKAIAVQHSAEGLKEIV
jgi:hypothetical protein